MVAQASRLLLKKTYYGNRKKRPDKILVVKNLQNSESDHPYYPAFTHVSFGMKAVILFHLQKTWITNGSR